MPWSNACILAAAPPLPPPGPWPCAGLAGGGACAMAAAAEQASKAAVTIAIRLFIRIPPLRAGATGTPRSVDGLRGTGSVRLACRRGAVTFGFREDRHLECELRADAAGTAHRLARPGAARCRLSPGVEGDRSRVSAPRIGI